MPKRKVFPEPNVELESSCFIQDRRLSIGVSKTVNTGNYESIKLHVGIGINIQENADFAQECSNLFTDCLEQIIKCQEDLQI